MLRAMDLIERDQARSQPPSGDASERGESLRMRALVASVVWLTLAIAIFGEREAILSVEENRWGNFLFAGFWAGWTVWLTVLLRRLARG
jgi:hypothetical protein